jgi:pimeloyl-ACP methyl ester carboxylesterase
VLDGVRRRRLLLPGSDLEIALLDWGGDGPLALLHHATGFCAALWDLVARPLRRHFRVIGMDARGHGDSSKPSAVSRWEDYGSDLSSVARTLAEEHGGRVALGLGHSFGATSMLMAAAGRSDLFERLVLVEPVMPPPAKSLQEIEPERAERLGGMVEAALTRRAVWPDRELAWAKWSGRKMFEDWLPEALELYVAEGLEDLDDGRVQLKCRPETEASIFAGGPAFDCWALAPRVSTPSLLLWATDGDFPRAVYERYAALMGDARVRDIDAGHFLPMERPDLVVRETLAFVGADQRSTG